jgi:ABC-type polar amino acid transport system ATPase subunit
MSEDRDQPWTPSQLAPADEGPLAREVQFLADLAQLAADRASAETQVEAQLRARTSASERALHDARQALAAQLAVDRNDMESDCTEQRQHALRRFEIDTAAVERQFAELEQQTAADYGRSTQRAARKLKEARWEAEALYEAAKEVAPRQLKEIQDNLETWLSAGQSQRELAQALLTSWRQTWTEEIATPSEPTGLSLSDAIERLKERVEFISGEQERLARLWLPGVAARVTPMWAAVLAGLLATLIAVAGVSIPLAVALGVVVLVGGVGVSIYLRRLAARQIGQIYPGLASAALEAEALVKAAWEAARAQAAAQQAEVVARRSSAFETAQQTYESRIQRATRRRDDRLQGPAVQYPQQLAEIAARRDRDLELAEGARARRYEEIQQKQADGAAIEERYLLRTEQIQRQHAAQWQTLTDQWKAGLARLQSMVDDIQGASSSPPAALWLADWGHFVGQAWSPTTAVPPAVCFGQFRVATDQIPDGMPRDARLAELTPASFSLPALVPFPAQPSLLFKARADGRRAAVAAMQAVMLRLLVSIPPGKLRFTLVDPVGLGENFAAFMHLADYNEALVTSRIWTDPKHIEQRLADISEHMENVIQKYLRNQFDSIEAYNREAGEIAEPYRFLVIANFPANFTEAAQRRLLSIATSGPRCGVYTIIMVDSQAPLPAGLSLADLERASATLVWQADRFVWRDERFGPFALTLDAPPLPDQMTEILQAAGRYANAAGKVEVPFEIIAPAVAERWTQSTRSGIDVPLGRAGATRLQYLKLGQGTSQHVLVAGKTGSGKSTLLHALVTSLALRYSPDEIELYLVDFKQGVEFKTYATARLPHARVVAIESDREFGLSVLAKLDEELKSRADRFRTAGVQDVPGFRAAQPEAVMPRILLVVDEFQEFFVEDDKIAQDAALLLDRLVRQGRAFGIHVLLGSQTLAGTYSLARSTIGQMAVRIALQCSETDAHLILSEDNSAARLLSRAGEAIYNDTNGLVEGNHPFQIVWLNDERRDTYLEQVRQLASQNGFSPRPQVVFEGNLPANLENNALLAQLLELGRPAQTPPGSRAWLGEAVAIKDPTAVTFRRQSGSNLLVVGQNDQLALGLFSSVFVSLAAGHPACEAVGTSLYLLDGSPVGSDQSAALAHMASMLPGSARVVSPRELLAVVGELSVEVERRQSSHEAHGAAIFVLVYGAHKLRDLRRREDDFSFSRAGDDRPVDVSKQFADVLRDGPAVGVHVVGWCDSVNNLNRTWDRQTLREFELRVALQMSAPDSSTLIDTPLAARLGPHRALLHSEEQSTLEKFRPYRQPAAEWLDDVGRKLQAPPSASRSEPTTADGRVKH